MNAVAGGSGRRLWPISRQASPKQFEPIVGEASTLQLAMERVAPRYGHDNIYIATNERYGEIIRRQLPDLPPDNIIFEPARRDLGPAVGLAMAHLSRVDSASAARPATCRTATRRQQVGCDAGAMHYYSDGKARPPTPAIQPAPSSRPSPTPPPCTPSATVARP